MLASLKAARRLGIDMSPKMIEVAKRKFTGIEFKVGDLESLNVAEKYDYVLLANIIGHVDDIQKAMGQLHKVCRPDTRIIIVYFNYLWEPILKAAEVVSLRMRYPVQHWLPLEEIENILRLCDFETVKKDHRFLVPVGLPLLSWFCNRFLVKLPLLRKLALNEVIVAKPIRTAIVPSEVSCSVIVPCRNERGNIEEAVRRMPKMGNHTEIIFVEGHSKDGTLEECYRVQKENPALDIKVFVQEGLGKGDAVRKGFDEASGEVLMILDADLTVPPEDLPKFFDALVSGKGEFIMGSRLVYQMEKQAMRTLNLMGNKFFSLMFTFLLEQRIRDTLCGTKVLWKKDYEKIAAGRHVFGDFDPFGDFDLIFGAAKLNLKIREIPIRYGERTYGTTQIDRFRHGLLLLRMVIFAAARIKFI